jgi:outer membrane protein assembly factor BamB
VPDWPEYHGGPGRAGVGPAAPALANPKKAWTAPVDGQVYAAPLIVGGRVFVATENNTVYALTLDTGALVWKSHLGSPVNAGSLPCGNIGPVTGITGTPAADARAGKLYVVGFVAGFHHVLFTLNLLDGSVLQQQVIDPAGSEPAVQQERAALSIASGYVYVPLGGLYGDCGNYHGYLVAVPVAGGALLSYRTPSARESGIWSSMGATVSPSGSVYVVTGNGSSTASFEYSNTVIELSADLRVLGYFAPSNWRALDDSDTDLGSVGVALLPDLGVLVSIGKEGVAYLLKDGRLGGVGGQVVARRVCAGAWGGSAWVGTTVFLPCADGLVAVSVSGTSLSVAWRASGVHIASPIVAAGAVWAIDASSATLFALDPASGSVRYQLALGSAQHFSTPAATEGYVVAPAGSAVVAVSTAP